VVLVGDHDQLAAGRDVGLLDVDLGVGELAAGGAELARLVGQRRDRDAAGGLDVPAGRLQRLEALVGVVDEQVDDPLALAGEGADRLDVDPGPPRVSPSRASTPGSSSGMMTRSLRIAGSSRPGPGG
jgi:hypothetical protein